MVQRIDPVVEEADPDEPMRYGNGKVVPSVANGVTKGTKELSFFFMVHSEGDPDRGPRLEMEVLKSGESIAKVPLSLRRTDGPATVPYLASIQAGALPGGDYQVIERLTEGGKTSERKLDFRIEGDTSEGEGAKGKGSAEDNEPETALGLQVPAPEGANGQELVITSLPASAVPPPSPEQFQEIIAAAESARSNTAKRYRTLFASRSRTGRRTGPGRVTGSIVTRLQSC